MEHLLNNFQGKGQKWIILKKKVHPSNRNQFYIQDYITSINFCDTRCTIDKARDN